MKYVKSNRSIGMILFSILIRCCGLRWCSKFRSQFGENSSKEHSLSCWILVNLPNFTPSTTNNIGSWRTNIDTICKYANINHNHYHLRMDVIIITVNFNTYVSTPCPDHLWHFPKCKLGWNSLELLQKLFQTCQKLSRDSVHIIQTACEISPCVCSAIKVGLWDDSLGLFHNLCSHSRSSKF